MKQKSVSILLMLALPAAALLLLFGMVRPVYAAVWVVGVDCTTIQECIDDAVASDTVFVPSGVYNESLTLNQPISLTGASRANTFVVALANQRVLTVTGAAIDSSVVISGLTFTGGNVNTGNQCAPPIVDTNCGGGILVTDNAQPHMQHITLRDNQAFYGGGIYAAPGSHLALEHVSFINNVTTLTGGGFYGSNISLTVTNGLFSGNESTQNVAGGLYVGATFSNFQSVLISGTTFIGNMASCLGGEFSICHAGGMNAFDVDTTIVNSHFEGNYCDRDDCDGGGLRLQMSFNDPEWIVRDTSFVNNSAGRHGGGVFAGNFVLNLPMHLSGGRFEGNTAVTGSGGGIHARTLILTGTQFLTNTAGFSPTFSFINGGGGGAFILAGTLAGATFMGNHSDSYGGGMAVQAFTGPMVIRDTAFINNSARLIGGGMAASQPLEIYDSLFAQNRTLQPIINPGTEEGNGGGLWVNNYVRLENTDFLSNTAVSAGGGAWVDFGDMHAVNGVFQDNQAQDSSVFFGIGGGGLFLTTGDLVFTGTQFVNNQSVNEVGGGAYVGGAVTGTGGLFQANQSGSSGGGLMVRTAVTLSGTQFISNTAVSSGGGLLADTFAVDGTPTTLTNTVFQGNQAGTGGGGLYSDGITRIDDSHFTNNSVGVLSGGGLMVFNAVTVTDSLVENNHSGGSGGGMAFGFDGGLVRRSLVRGNTAVNQGGGISANGAVTLEEATIAENHSDGHGGGIATSGFVIAVNSDILSNTAVTNGGGIQANSGMNFTNGRFQNNDAGGNGGGYFGGLGGLRTNGTLFINNHADGNGGGANAFDGNAVHHTVFTNNTASNTGGGLFLQRFVHVTTTLFVNNAANFGGGLAVVRPNIGTLPQYVINSIFARNHARISGEAIYYNQPRPIEFTHVTIANAAREPGVGIYVVTGTVAITNSIIASFTTGLENAGGTVTSHYNLFFGNLNNRVGVIPHNNTLDNVDPVFVDAATDDFRLVFTSPAINSGVDAGVTTDFLGQPRPLDGGFERGAFEGRFTPTAVYLTHFSAGVHSPLGVWLAGLLLVTAVTTLVWRKRAM